MIATEVGQILDKLQEITEEAIARLDLMNEEELLQLAGQREELVKALEVHRPKITPEHRVQIAYILGFDSLIINRMSFLKNEAGQWIQKQGAIKSQQNAYHNAYAMNSVFIDHKN
ncbi:hypothetical protein [Saccharibacillus sp. JS10]|uniref:hypothetical protein n=1 Tax=Saccharibacillus sp. JS10 TaxID=2950552 RepID=UPI00210B49CC|nr:hypothetical protein [Saccharibacillus sp. JS10]MCQ4088815.1 hypothetical protein [Saccharibacillus sp. JS10]